MTTKELLKLDAWIAEHVMGMGGGCAFNPTTDYAAAMMVLEKCLHKVLGQISIMSFESEKRFTVTSNSIRPVLGMAEANTLPLAICRFAKKMFSK